MKTTNVTDALHAVDGPAPSLLGRNFVLACLTSFTSFSSFYLLLVTLPVYVTQVGGTESDVGLLIGVFSATAVTLRLFVGRAVDTLGKKPFMVWGTVLMAACAFLYLVTSTVPMLLGVRVLHGAGWALFGTAVSALVADVVPPHRRGEAVGYYGMFANLAMAVGPAAGMALMTTQGFTVLFLVAAAVAVLSVAGTLAIEEESRRAPDARTLLRRNWRDYVEPTALFPSSVLALVGVGYGAVVSFLPLVAEKRGLGNPGVFFSVFAVTVLVARTVTGTLSDRRGRAVVIVPGQVLGAGALALLAVATSSTDLVVVAVLYGLSFAALQPGLMAMVVDRAPPARRGAAMGTFATAMDVGIGGGSFAWGFVAQRAGFTVMYAAAAGTAAVSLALFLAGNRRTRTPG